jgi:nitroreductase
VSTSAEHRFGDAEREAVYRAIAERRDMRHFSSEPIDEPTLRRLLHAGLFEPADLARLLDMPAGAKPIAILCLGHVDAFYPAPMLQLQGWTSGRPLQDFAFHNRWNETGDAG